MFGQKYYLTSDLLLQANTKDMLGQLNILANSNNDNEVFYTL